jgi:Rrf2 family iron-sulfur cluster assembly transcriptional regulator
MTQSPASLMPISRKFFHAIEATIYIALYHSTLPISGKLLAENQGLPPRYLELMMQRLVHAGLLRSIRGPRGGYVLAKERRRITLGDIIESLQHDDPEDAIRTTHSALGDALLQPICLEIGMTMLAEFKKYTLAQLCEDAYAKNLVSVAAKTPSYEHKRQDFNI